MLLAQVTLLPFLRSWPACIIRQSPDMGGQLNCVWQRTPGISPLRGSLRAAPILWSVAGQGYHCRQKRSWQSSLPKLLWDGLNRWAPCCRSFNAGTMSCTGGLGVPSKMLAFLLKLFNCRICNFQGAFEAKKSLTPLRHLVSVLSGIILYSP